MRVLKNMLDTKLWRLLGFAIIAVYLIQFFPVSALAIQPKEVIVVGDKVFVKRTFPTDSIGLSRPRISYVETVTPLTRGHNNGHFCTDSGGPTRYNKSHNIGEWSIPWASDCLSDPVGFTWEACWSWHLGTIKAGATCLRETFINGVAVRSGPLD